MKILLDYISAIAKENGNAAQSGGPGQLPTWGSYTTVRTDPYTAVHKNIASSRCFSWWLKSPKSRKRWFGTAKLIALPAALHQGPARPQEARAAFDWVTSRDISPLKRVRGVFQWRQSTTRSRCRIQASSSESFPFTD